MPHIRLEYTDNIYVDELNILFKDVQNILIKIAEVKSENCKSRAISLDSSEIISDGKNVRFVHLEINILEGRTAEIKKQIGKESLNLLKSHFNNDMNGNLIQHSVEIREMKHSDYFTSNTL